MHAENVARDQRRGGQAVEDLCTRGTDLRARVGIKGGVWMGLNARVRVRVNVRLSTASRRPWP